jgi:hypothetical protein
MIEEGDKNIMKIKITFLVAVAVALFGFSAASASAAHLFLAAKYPVLVKATSLNLQGFKAGAAVSVCEKGLFMTGEEGSKDPTGPLETLLIHPIYHECEVSIAAKFKAKVLTTGCNYVFHALAPSEKHATVDVECEAGKSIKVEVEGLSGCIISIGSQLGLKAIEYKNEPAGKVAVNAEVSNIKWEATEACGLGGLSGTEGEYREGEIVAGVAKLASAGHPAKADSEGIFGSLKEADAIDVA